MHVALFILYTIACGYGLIRLPLLRKTGIRPRFLLALFALHVAVGCMHNLIAWRYYPGHGDIWDDYQWSLTFRQWLFNDSTQFLLHNSKWTYFTHNGVVFIQLLFNFLSGDNIYINTLLFNFFLFMGNAGLYQVFRRHFPADPLTALTVFLLPSTLFWTSCIHREGILYLLLGLFFYQLDRYQLDRIRQRRAIWFAAIFFLLTLYFRFTVALLLLPAILVGLLAERRPSLKRLLVPATGVTAVILIALLAFPSLPDWVLTGLAHWQAEFQILEGHSRLYLPSLDGTWRSLWSVFPYAVRNGLFEPLPGSGGQPIYLAFAIELIFIWLIVGIALVTLLRPTPSTTLSATLSATPSIATSIAPSATPSATSSATQSATPRDGFSALCLSFSIPGMILIGVFVPFVGAIVRYRSLFLPFLLAPALHLIRDFPIIRRINKKLQAGLSPASVPVRETSASVPVREAPAKFPGTRAPDQSPGARDPA